MEGISGTASWGRAHRGHGRGGPQQPRPALSPQRRDSRPLRPGTRILQMLGGEHVLCEEGVRLHPKFIDEAAYDEKGVASVQTQKLAFSVPVLPVPALAPTPAPNPGQTCAASAPPSQRWVPSHSLPPRGSPLASAVYHVSGGDLTIT